MVNQKETARREGTGDERRVANVHTGWSRTARTAGRRPLDRPVRQGRGAKRKPRCRDDRGHPRRPYGRSACASGALRRLDSGPSRPDRGWSLLARRVRGVNFSPSVSPATRSACWVARDGRARSASESGRPRGVKSAGHLEVLVLAAFVAPSRRGPANRIARAIAQDF